jgi:hypothetical protein
LTNLVPGFIWTPIDVGKRDARTKGRGVIGHVAVSNSKDLRPGPLATRPSDWTFYFPKIGPARQYIDLDLQCWSSGAGNATCPAWESEGGMGTAAQVNAEPWTHDQLVSGAMVLRHLHETEGVPYQNMGTSLAGSKGLGVHRYGIDPWRVAGGQVWSSSRGKLCPGDAKVGQLQLIVDLAASGQPLTYGTPDVWAPPVVGPAPVPPAPPAPSHPWVPDLPSWDLPVGHWFGNKAGGAKQHGGFYIGERDNIKGIQRAFIVLGCVPGVATTNWQSGWADGLWEAATDVACRNWFARHRPGQQFSDRIFADDYAALQRCIA